MSKKIKKNVLQGTPGDNEAIEAVLRALTNVPPCRCRACSLESSQLDSSQGDSQLTLEPEEWAIVPYEAPAPVTRQLSFQDCICSLSYELVWSHDLMSYELVLSHDLMS